MMLPAELKNKLENFDFAINDVNQIVKFVTLAYDELQAYDLEDYQWFTDKMTTELLNLTVQLDRYKFDIYQTLAAYGNWENASNEQLDASTSNKMYPSLYLDIVAQLLRSKQIDRALQYRNRFEIFSERYNRINDLIVYNLLEKK